MKSAFRRHEGDAGKSSHVVHLNHSTLTAVGSVVGTISEGEVTLSADTGLCIDGVDLIESTLDEDTVACDEGVADTASTGIELGEVGLVGGASLADVLDDYESGEAFADSINEVLVDSAGVDANTLLHDTVVFVSWSAFAAVSVDGYEAFCAVAVEGVDIEDLIFVTSVAAGVPAIFNFSGGFAARMVTPEVVVVGESSHCE